MLFKKHTVACILFVFDILLGRLSSSSMLSMIHIVVPWYQTRGGDFLRVRFHRTNYVVHEPFNDAVRGFIDVIGQETVCESRQVGIIEFFDPSVFLHDFYSHFSETKLD
jgi:hypothetical protein